MEMLIIWLCGVVLALIGATIYQRRFHSSVLLAALSWPTALIAAMILPWLAVLRHGNCLSRWAHTWPSQLQALLGVARCRWR